MALPDTELKRVFELTTQLQKCILHQGRGDTRELHNCLLGLTASCLYTMAITNVAKILFGRPRPYFATLCWGDEVAAPADNEGYWINTATT